MKPALFQVLCEIKEKSGNYFLIACAAERNLLIVLMYYSNITLRMLMLKWFIKYFTSQVIIIFCVYMRF